MLRLLAQPSRRCLVNRASCRVGLGDSHNYHNSRKYATPTNLDSYPNPGEKLHGFTLQGKKHVPELQLTALRLRHDKTGADYLHLAREDRNNVFSIGFKTNPPDSTGVPHILEHTTLCGSERYVSLLLANQAPNLS